MSTTYTSTIEVNVWKEHTCLDCGTVYRYLFKRTKKGQGATPDAAAAAAHNAVVSALANEVDMQPCPGCGSYQPDMIGAMRSRRHWWAFWIGTPFFLLWLILIMADVIPYSTGAYFLVGTAAVMGLWHLLLDVVNPNANLDGNQRLAEDREEAGDLWRPRGRKGEGTGEAVGSGIGGGHFVAYMLLVGGMLAFLAPALYFTFAGLKYNAEWHPEAIGPGDTAYIYFKDSVRSVKGYWRATARATVTNLAELGLPPGQPLAFQASSKNDSWGNSISVKSSEKDNSSRLWARVVFPDDPRLVGKTVRLRIDLDARYPQLRGTSSWQETASNATMDKTVILSGVKAGSTFKSIWWMGALLGLTLSVAAGIMLPLVSSSFRKRALPTAIFVLDEDGPRENDEDSDNEDSPRRDEGGGDRPRERDEGGRDRYRMRDDEDRGDDYRRRDR